MKITCERVGEWGEYPLYLAQDVYLDLRAYGTSHYQAISNVLGLRQAWQLESK